MEERWKPVDDYPNYEVSDFGNVRNVKTNRVLKPTLAKGYQRVVLCKNNECRPFTVHKLVVETFDTKDRDNLQVNHIDGNKLNNRLDNLELVTGSENISHAYRTGLKKPPCPNPRRVQIVETGEIFDTAASCARSIHGSKSHVCECMNGERSTHKGYHFKEIAK